MIAVGRQRRVRLVYEMLVRQALASISGVLNPGVARLYKRLASSAYGRRIIQQRTNFHDYGPFSVRYWSPADLKQAFEKTVGPTRVRVNCCFGLGLQPRDARFMPPVRKMILRTSELLRASACVYPRWCNALTSYTCRPGNCDIEPAPFVRTGYSVRQLNRAIRFAQCLPNRAPGARESIRIDGPTFGFC